MLLSQDSYASTPEGRELSESYVPSSNFASTVEGIIESGPHQGV